MEIFGDFNKQNGIIKYSVKLNTMDFYIVSRENINNLKINNERSFIYFLVSDNEIYIGRSEDIKSRMMQHKNKDFWNYALLITSDHFDIVTTQVLEADLIAYFKDELSNYYLHNKTIPAPNTKNLTENKLYEIQNYFAKIKDILEFKSITNNGSAEIFYLTNKNQDFNAKLIVKDGKYIILKGSKIRENKMNSDISDFPTELLEKNNFITDRDYSFNSPSKAAVFVMRRSANGWTEFKNTDGKTLDDVYRK